jgi:phage/plasmid-like protein (TIGR03299 family)
VFIPLKNEKEIKMAHELEILSSGVASHFFVGATPWHGLGVPLMAPPTVCEGLKAAGLDWDVSLQDLFIQRPIIQADGSTVPQLIGTGTGKAVIRGTDGRVLGIVGDRYKPLQNAHAFDFFDPFVTSGAVSLETAGSLHGGRKIWVLARVKGATAEIGRNDPVEAFLLLSNSHDGTTTIQVGFTPVRVVCQNTLNMAMGNNRGLIRIYHTKSAQDVLKVVGETMDTVNQQFAATVEQMRFLTTAKINREDVKKYIRMVFDPAGDVNSEDTAARPIGQILPLFDGAGRGATLDTAAGTVWGAYNAVTEYLNYLSGRTQDNRLRSLWFGPNQEIGVRALSVATDMAKAA